MGHGVGFGAVSIELDRENNGLKLISVPMNKIVVGNAPSPNLVTAQSRIGSLSNTQHKV